MQMTKVLDKLKDLQDVLAQKYELEGKIEELPKSLDGSIESLERFKKDFIQINENYEEQKAKVQALKVDLDQAIKTREDGEKGMDAAQTHREYEILEKQINEAAQKEEELRKTLQVEERTLSDLSANLKDTESLISATEGEVNEAKAGLENELKDLKSEIDSLKKKEEKISTGIDSETVIKFQRIIRRNRKGIVAVKGNVCDGCHMILPAQFANEVRQGDKILFCPYCSRILFYEENDVSYSNFSTEDYDSSDDLYDEDLLKEDGEDYDDDDEALGKSSDYDNE